MNDRKLKILVFLFALNILCSQAFATSSDYLFSVDTPLIAQTTSSDFCSVFNGKKGGAPVCGFGPLSNCTSLTVGASCDCPFKLLLPVRSDAHCCCDINQ